TVGGRAAWFDPAALGTKRATLLRRRGSRAAKLAAVEPVARWLVDVACETARAPEALAAQRSHYAQEVVPFWADEGAPAGLVEALAQVPGAFQHNDMAEGNLVLDGGDFPAPASEGANPTGPPPPPPPP